MLVSERLRSCLMVCVAFLAISLCLTGPVLSAKAKAPLVDLNAASQSELETLKGIGPATAKKIIAARPYKSVDELDRAGLTAKNVEALKPLVTVGPAPAADPGGAAPKQPTKATGSPQLIDLNTASQQELESLPGIGKISANKIMAARPLKSVDDLAEAGVAAKNISILKPLVTVSSTKATAAPAAVPPKQVKSTVSANVVDLNTASQQELETLPEIGKASARKIMAARPFKSVDELSKAGLGAKSIAVLKPLVTVSSAPVTSTKTAPASPAPIQPKAATPPGSKAAATVAKLAPGESVNINTASKEKLQALPEIGPVKAQAIINNRPYKKIDDIMKVKGIKEKTFGKIKDVITVE